MTDDKVVHPAQLTGKARVTGSVPSENPDRFFSNDLRDVPADILPAGIFQTAKNTTTLRQVEEELERAIASLNTALEAVRETLRRNG